MGCASSAYSKTANRETFSKQHRAISTNAIPTDVVPLKDMPEVVEKIIDVLKDTDVEIVTVLTSDSIKNVSTTSILKDTLFDTNSGSSPQGYVQGFLDDNDSVNLREIVQEDIRNYKIEDIVGMPLFRDFDSLDTSSPESEIEEALANNNSLNPPTPKPTLTELEDLYIFPTSNVYQENTVNSPSKDKKKIHPINKFAVTPISLSEPTDWEKQADMLANTRKYNPVEAMRKLKRDSTRAASSQPHRDLRSRNQHYIEETINDYFSQTCTQGLLQSDISSAKTGRGDLLNSYSTDTDTFHGKNAADHSNEDQGVNTKNHSDKPPHKQNLTVKKITKLPSSPSNFKIRERCAVCCNKYKT